MDSYAPIVIFAFNRPQALKECIRALLSNPEAAESDLFVFIDGPRPGRGEEGKVDAVKAYAGTICGFRSVEVKAADTNKGLGPSVIDGISAVIERYGRVIVVEDDLVVSRHFLAFINAGLEKYQQEQKVFSICGCSHKVTRPEGYSGDAYFCHRSNSCGWGTWKDRWDSCDWELKDWESVRRKGHAFNRWGGSDCFKLLKDWKEGRNKSWAIRFCYSEFIQGKVSLFPLKTLVINIGFDGEGTNCRKWSRFKYEPDLRDSAYFVFPDTVSVNKSLLRQNLHYHSLILRAYSRIMYMLT